MTFRVSTGWGVPRADPLEDLREHSEWFHAMAAGLFYHSLVPMRPGQRREHEACELLGGRPCYSDGTYAGADEPWRVLRAEGSAGLWDYLARYYRQVFRPNAEDGPAPPTFRETLSLACEMLTGQPLPPEEDRDAD